MVIKEPKRKRGADAEGLAVGVALLAGLASAAAGFGTRWGLWEFQTGFQILRWGFYGGVAAAAIALLGIIFHLGLRRAFLGLVAIGGGLALAWIPYHWFRIAQEVPAIHDITTDTENPPQFVAILALRKDAPNPAEYGGPEVAALQKQAYPDLKPLILHEPMDRVFPQALAVAKEMDWAVVDQNPSEGRIEATATTFWFGFKDDVVVRLTAVEGGTRVDVRSVSRVGKSDLGTNACRIREFLNRLRGSG